MSLIETFVAHMRHELRTPLNAILGYAQILLEEHGDSLSVEARHDLERVTEAGHQLVRIVTEAFDALEQSGGDVTLCEVVRRLDWANFERVVQGFQLARGSFAWGLVDGLTRGEEVAA